MTAPKLTPLGDANAVVCEDGVCAVPDADPAHSGSVISATTAPNADSSESASTNIL